MNRSILKNYAPQARRDFIQAITDRASFYGLTEKKTEPVTFQGDVALIGGRPFPKKVGEQRKRLEERIARQGFEQTIEAVAYTWFNRLVAIRFMELHEYLEHGYRVLSHPEGKPTPEILEQAEHVDLPGVDPQQVIDLKLAGDKDAELYRMLLIAQCNALHRAMPFLFERIDDETELLLPDNLLHSDSLIRTLVSEIPEGDWQEVEIIGWLYQFYISEKKDEVIGKVVKSEDIPAATQLFTPNWIVKYLVQNSLGRQWVATYPDSPLKGQMEYYIEPAEQTPEVQEQLKAITPTSLNPEELTLLDPACGSGHILVEAYDLLKAIYQERGYRAKDIPRLILTKNLFGLEIDDRAAQLAAFALMMKARADDRRIFAEHVEPHVLSIQESGRWAEGSGQEIADVLFPADRPLHTAVCDLIDLFEHGKTFGSLIRVPENLAEKLPAIAQRVEDVLAHGGMFEELAARRLKPLVEQAWILAGKYDAVVTNPPYMGKKFYNSTLKTFVYKHFPTTKSDLYAAFMERNLASLNPIGFVGMITIPNWLFLSGFSRFREALLTSSTIHSLIHNGRGVWGSDFGSCSFVIWRHSLRNYKGAFRRLFDAKVDVATGEELERRFFTNSTHFTSAADLLPIPDVPIAYWVHPKVREAFSVRQLLKGIATPRQGLATTDNDRFVRLWYELPFAAIGFDLKSRVEAQESNLKWFPYNKGGEFRKWYGNMEHVVNWHHDGKEVKANIIDRYPYLNGNPDYVAKNPDCYFRPSLSWSKVTMGEFTIRFFPPGFVFDVSGCSVFVDDENIREPLAGYLNSVVAKQFLEVLAPTVNYETGHVANIPIPQFDSILSDEATDVARRAIELAKADWELRETAWGFRRSDLVGYGVTIQDAWTAWCRRCEKRIAEMLDLENRNDRLYITAFDFADILQPTATDDRITLSRPQRQEDIKRLISYAIGCMMGRYSLDKPGLIYAHSGGKGFDPNQYQTFPADEDGIIPLTDLEWFEDDAANRLEKFIATAWSKEHLEENLKFVADSLGPNRGERPRETIRRYLATGFYKHHLQMYKRRPIYWLFSSGKQRAFQCLVYLHRYNEGTLSRMRTEYVTKLQGKIDSRIDHLAEDIAAASATSHRKKLEKERDTLLKHRAELLAFDEKLRHYADQRITLDLDDGVKVNYGRFGDLLAEVKAVTGSKAEE